METNTIIIIALAAYFCIGAAGAGSYAGIIRTKIPVANYWTIVFGWPILIVSLIFYGMFFIDFRPTIEPRPTDKSDDSADA